MSAMNNGPLAIRTWRFLLVLVVGLGITGCEIGKTSRWTPVSHPASWCENHSRSLARGVQFLTTRQSPDGAWRSDTYGVFKDGPSLTPLVLHMLLDLPGGEIPGDEQRKGAAYLAAMVQRDGSIDPGPLGLSYPVYTAAGAVIVLSDPVNASHRKARDAWLALLRQRQLTEDLGWHAADKEYGGWGFSSGLPRKPPTGQPVPPLTESNLSATVFALEALRWADCDDHDPAFRKALTFVQRCQNYNDDPKSIDPVFDDGGFFFIYDDPIRNKAGAAGKDKMGRERFFSYGSTSADGLHALLACGCRPSDPRVFAARAWLEKNLSVDKHPGNYAKDRESARPSVYYYYCWSLAQGLKAVGCEETILSGGEKVHWAEAMANALEKRQQPDGSWSNPAVAVREDDPVVATALAAGAMAICRSALKR